MSIKSSAKTVIKETIDSLKRYKNYQVYSSRFKHYLELQHFENKKAKGEEEYIKKWEVLCPRVEPYSYRFFSHFCGYNPNIVPEDIGHSYIENILNPREYRHTYADKNLFPEIIGKDHVARTIVCRINGSNLLDANYKNANDDLSKYIGNSTSLILKPSINSSSGSGILKFEKKGEIFVSEEENITLSKSFLLSYQKDFCLQETVCQHSFMKMLCSTSVNTMRLCLYRSVSNEEPIVTASIIRIGKDGSFVDNAHAGGMFIGVDVSTGEMGKYVIDQYGNKQETWNGIDYSKNTYIVPNWNDVISFAKYIGTRIHHHRLIALDIALDENGKPILIEYNINGFSFWLFMYTNQEVFGKYTDEVIDYCRRNKKQSNKEGNNFRYEGFNLNNKLSSSHI